MLIARKESYLFGLQSLLEFRKQVFIFQWIRKRISSLFVDFLQVLFPQLNNPKEEEEKKVTVKLSLPKEENFNTSITKTEQRRRKTWLYQASR